MPYELEGGMVWYGMEQEGRIVIWNRRDAVISHGGRHILVWSRENIFCMEMGRMDDVMWNRRKMLCYMNWREA